MPRYLTALSLVASLSAGPLEAQVYTRVNRDGVVEATNVPARGFQLTYPGKGTLIHSRGFRGRYHGEYDTYVVEAAAAHAVPPDLIRAVIQVESEFDRRAVSSKGAMGLMQLMPFTARRFGVSNPFDPRQNIFGGTRYLRFLLDLFHGDVKLVLAGYNAGENAVRRHKGVPPYKETRRYVRKVQALLSRAAPRISWARAPAVRRAALQRATRPQPRRRGTIDPARPRIYYRWHDSRGRLRVAQTPPGDGVTYTMIRALW